MPADQTAALPRLLANRHGVAIAVRETAPALSPFRGASVPHRADPTVVLGPQRQGRDRHDLHDVQRPRAKRVWALDADLASALDALAHCSFR